MEKNLNKEAPIKEETKPDGTVNFSTSIKNAHASGDGSIKRSNEAIDLPKEDAGDQPSEKNSY